MGSCIFCDRLSPKQIITFRKDKLRTNFCVSFGKLIVSWAISSFDMVASFNITATFLNAQFPPGKVVLRLPFCWRAHKAIYGLREAPSLSRHQKLRSKARGEETRVVVKQMHNHSLCMVVEERGLLHRLILHRQTKIHKQGSQSTDRILAIIADMGALRCAA